MDYAKDVRKTWIPLLKIVVASTADIVGDWKFYKETSDLANPDLRKDELALLVFFYISCVMGGFTIIAVFCKGYYQYYARSEEDCLNKFCRMNTILFFELFLEDIPQFVLTGMISQKREELTPLAVFNLTTSAFNFIFNIFEIATPLYDDDVCKDCDIICCPKCKLEINQERDENCCLLCKQEKPVPALPVEKSS